MNIYGFFLRVIWPILGLDRSRAIDKVLFNEDMMVIERYISDKFGRWTTGL